MEILGGAALDCAVLDAEHAPFDRASLDVALLAGRAMQLPLLVRVLDYEAAGLLSVLAVVLMKTPMDFVGSRHGVAHGFGPEVRAPSWLGCRSIPRSSLFCNTGIVAGTMTHECDGCRSASRSYSMTTQTNGSPSSANCTGEFGSPRQTVTRALATFHESHPELHYGPIGPIVSAVLHRAPFIAILLAGEFAGCP